VEFRLPMIQYPTNSFRPVAAGARLLRLCPEGGGAEFRDQPTSTLDAFRAQASYDRNARSGRAIQRISMRRVIVLAANPAIFRGTN